MNVKDIILKATGATAIHEKEHIQELWSGYGKIIRYELEGSNCDTVVVKHVHFPNKQKSLARISSNDLSHKRKLKSYSVEMAWYSRWSQFCNEACRVPGCLALKQDGDEVLMVLEDIDSSGFMGRKTSVTWVEVKACLSWLANFHAVFMGEKPDGLWKNGTYWHLDTRPEELLALDDVLLKKSAGAIDLKLKQSPYQTFVHGDAKLANFCFSNSGQEVAAVDFQYVGGGCGMKDLAYFVASCYGEKECEQLEGQILDEYFRFLKQAISKNQKTIDMTALENDWRSLYPVAWTDFQRFYKGWAPGHRSINSYSERVAHEVLIRL